MIALDATTILRLTEYLIALALIQQTVELLEVREVFAQSGVWTWETVNSEFGILARFPVAKVFAGRGFTLLLVSQLLAAIALLFFSNCFLLTLLFTTALLIASRFQGTFNGGSDYMTLLILGALTVATSWPGAIFAALWYIAIQSGLSYFVSGLSKLRVRDWRNGKQLRVVILNSIYAVPENVKRHVRNAKQTPLTALSWAALLFECLFPIAFLSPNVCLGFLAMGFLFHLTIAYLFGLNRFLTAWIASYPAIFYASIYITSYIHRR